MIIKGKNIELKSKLRSLLIFEQIARKPFAPNSITDMVLYFYSVILANYPNIELTFDELMDEVDENPNLFTEFTAWIEKQSKRNSVFDVSSDSKKK